MTNMLDQFYDQLKIKYDQLHTAEARREVLRDNMNEKVSDAHKAISDLVDQDHEIGSIWGEIKNLRDDIDSLTGT